MLTPLWVVTFVVEGQLLSDTGYAVAERDHLLYKAFFLQNHVAHGAPPLANRFAFFGAGELAGPRAQTSARLNSRFNCCMNCLRSAPALLGGPNLGRTTRYTQ